MNNILVAYTTSSGSTEEIAQAIADELGKAGLSVETRRLEEIATIEPYAAVVIGAPMIVGWHRAAMKFVKQHQAALSRRPVAYFLTAMSLTQTGQQAVKDVPLAIDPALAMPPRNPDRLGLKERYASPAHYAGDVLDAAPMVKPVSVAIFGGRLDLYKLKLLPMLFVMAIIQAQPGDRRNWPFIRNWAAGLQASFRAHPAWTVL